MSSGIYCSMCGTMSAEACRCGHLRDQFTPGYPQPMSQDTRALLGRIEDLERRVKALELGAQKLGPSSFPVEPAVDTITNPKEEYWVVNSEGELYAKETRYKDAKEFLDRYPYRKLRILKVTEVEG